LNHPDAVGRSALALGALVWMGVWAGRTIGGPAVASCLGIALIVAILTRSRQWPGLMAVVVLAGTISGWLSAERDLHTLEASVPEGVVEVIGRAVDDPRPGPTGYWFIIEPELLRTRDGDRRWNGPSLLVGSMRLDEVMAGDRVAVSGRLTAQPGRVRGDAYAGRISGRVIEVLESAGGVSRVANLARSRVERELADQTNRPAAALVSGFLIGDIRELPPADGEALRRAGLSHYVAVSGSNVALFLALWWLLLGPLGFGPRRRAVLGLAGLVLFVFITRWEPSVLRASVMAGLVLVARSLGMSIGPWTALGGGVTVLLLVSGELVSDAGFQLSVAATAGVILGAGMRPFRRLPFIGAALAATSAAQLAVAPLLLIHFGTLPLLSPVTNLLAGPLVVAATGLGGIGALTGVDLLTDLAGHIAAVVLAIARAASPWPQIGWFGLAGVLTAIVFGRVTGLRRPMALVAAVWTFITLGLSPTPVSLPAAVFLDVGQGDATLLLSDDGSVVLIDGGPDPGVLLERLRHYGIERIDLMVASHEHHDHVAGLVAALGQFPVGLIWHSGRRNPGPDMAALLDEAERRGVRTEVVRPGWSVRVGRFVLEAKGPMRHYASPNDQSVVLLVQVGNQTILMPGDIEKYAQNDLGPIKVDILKVPHQGAATSDLDWIRSTGAGLAVIPVGPNDYGHPSPEVIRVLEQMGSRILRTDFDGDVVVSVGD
jgi:competence protein ComEC